MGPFLTWIPSNTSQQMQVSYCIALSGHVSCEDMFFSAPTAPPSNVNVTDVTSSTITVQWEMVQCDDQNGPITGYSVRYGVMGSSEREIEEVVGDQRTATISGLAAATVYEYEVAGITTADTGAYSDQITTLTQGICI